MNKEIEAKIEQIADSQELRDVIMQTAEEVGELLQALSKHRRFFGYGQPLGKYMTVYEAENAVLEELVDVLVMVKELQIKFGFSDEAMQSTMQTKVERTLSRIISED
jgi:NTP pyrophosphatase (non-canonical NTP hydrolase)